MSELTPQLTPEVITASTAGAEEAAGALGRAFDGEFTVEVGEAATYAAEAPPEGCDGPGLALLFAFAGVGMAALLPESSGLLPEWYREPDPTGVSRLSTLAQELSMLLVPEDLMADVFEGRHVDNLSEAVGRTAPADDAAMVPLTITSGDKSAVISLVWPLATPGELFPPAPAEPEAAPEPAAPAAASPPAPAATPPPGGNVASLPAHSQSLLKVQVPLSVALACKKESVQEIIELAPGTIIKFEKSCDELLQLHAGNQPIAEGEAVKVGEKFGFRVSAMLLPQERFVTATAQVRQAG